MESHNFFFSHLMLTSQPPLIQTCRHPWCVLITLTGCACILCSSCHVWYLSKDVNFTILLSEGQLGMSGTSLEPSGARLWPSRVCWGCLGPSSAVYRDIRLCAPLNPKTANQQFHHSCPPFQSTRFSPVIVDYHFLHPYRSQLRMQYHNVPLICPLRKYAPLLFTAEFPA